MSTIAPDQLPSPVSGFTAPAASPFTAPAPGQLFGPAQHFVPAAQPAAPAPRRPQGNRLVAAIVGGLVLVGGVAVAATRHGDSTPAATAQRHQRTTDDRTKPSGTDPAPTIDEGNDDGGLTDAVVGQAYTLVFGTQGSAATLECVAGGLDDAGSTVVQNVVDWTGGAQLTFDEAQDALIPFAACAPDQDLLVSMLPAAVQIVGGSADEACVTQLIVSLNVEGRAEALALAYSDAQEFQARMYSTFSQCVV